MLLVVDRKEAIIKCISGIIHVYHDNQLVQKASVTLLEQVVFYGNARVDCAVFRALSEAGVPTVMLASRGKQPAAMVGAGLATRLPLRRLQYRCAESNNKALALARWLLVRKFLGYALPSTLLSQQYSMDITPFKQQHEVFLHKLHRSNTLASLMGIEGIQAKNWFNLLANSLPSQWKFSGRNRRPPQDPVNALLSLTYTMALSDIRQVLIDEGFDPAFGFLHQPEAGREALLLDVLEIFRCVLDVFVLDLLDTLESDDFYYRTEEGCRLNKESRPLYYQSWAEFRQNCPRPIARKHGLSDWPMAPFREQIRGQVQQLRLVMTWIDENG